MFDRCWIGVRLVFDGCSIDIRSMPIEARSWFDTCSIDVRYSLECFSLDVPISHYGVLVVVRHGPCEFHEEFAIATIYCHCFWDRGIMLGPGGPEQRAYWFFIGFCGFSKVQGRQA